MQGHTKDDGDGAVGQPVGNRDAHAGQETQRTGGLVPEDGQPAHGFAPGGDHVGNDHQHADELLAGKVAADDQPGQNRAQWHGNQNRKQSADKRILQRPPQGCSGKLTYKKVLPIVEGETADLGIGIRPADAGQLCLGRGEGGCHHLQQRDHNQTEQNHQGHCHNHIERILDNIQKFVLQTGLCQWMLHFSLFHFLTPSCLCAACRLPYRSGTRQRYSCTRFTHTFPYFENL